jgi:PhoH-like ATPase
MAYVIDTNVLLSGNVEDILKKYEVIIPSVVLREIENLERKKGDRALQFEVRRAKRAINKYLEDGLVKVDFSDYKNAIDDFEEDYADNIILSYALENNHALITNDILMKLKAKGLEIEVVSGNEKDESDYYTGFTTEVVSKDELTEIYRNRFENVFNLLVNQYAVILSDTTAQITDVLKWDGEMLISLGDRRGMLASKFSTMQFGKFETKDIYQLMAVDSIENNKITMIRGKAGSGKSLIALSVAWNYVEKKKYRLLIFANTPKTRDSVELGYNKGDFLEKISQSSLGAMLKSKFGDWNEVLYQIEKGNLTILPFSDLRGYDTTFGESDQNGVIAENTITLISEAQNLTSNLLKMGLQRIGENTKVIIDGDYHQQIDMDAYANDNGMIRASEVFRDRAVYGEVELQNVYRSEIAEIAELM